MPRHETSSRPTQCSVSLGDEMHNKEVVLLSLLLALVACSEAPQAEPVRPQQAGQPLDPVRTAVRINALRAEAMLGDQAGARRQMEALNDDLRRSMKLADPSRKVDREAGRVAAKNVDGVRSAVWIDHENLLAIVARNEQRSYDTIDQICMRLEPLGDTLGVVVNLQSGAAVNGDQLEILSRNCQLLPGDRALLQRERQVDVIDPVMRAQHRANQTAAPRAGSAAEQAENARILEAGTPEM